MSPEVLEKHYNEECDIWALGISLIYMLTKKYLFSGKDLNEVYSNILSS